MIWCHDYNAVASQRATNVRVSVARTAEAVRKHYDGPSLRLRWGLEDIGVLVNGY